MSVFHCLLLLSLYQSSILICCLFNDAVSSSDYIALMAGLMNNELEIIIKEAAVA
jgi:hypothetical protein